MAKNVKYLSYDGLNYFWNQKLKPIIEENEEVTAVALIDLNNRINTHTHSYVASAAYATTASVAYKVSNKLTLKVGNNAVIEYDGSSTATAIITAANLGLSTVFDYKGITTIDLTTNPTSNPISIDTGAYHQKIGDVVIVDKYPDKEYFWNGSKWEELGRIIDLSGYASTAHKHSATDITSGTLSVTSGGTGLSTIAAGHVIIGNGTGTPSTFKIVGITNSEIDTICGS